MTENDKDKEIDRYFADILTEKPHGFSVNGNHFFLYPMSLGKYHILRPLIESLGINPKILQVNVHAEALRLAKAKRDVCLNIICLHTCKGKDEVYDPMFIEERIKVFDKEMSDEDIAVLMIIVLTADKTDMLIRHFNIDKEQADIQKIMAVKKKSDKNSYNFGGQSVYGSFIQPLLEMGLGWDEIMWERSYTNLRLLLADKTLSVYLTDEERKQVHVTHDRERVNGDDRAAILAAIKSQSWD